MADEKLLCFSKYVVPIYIRENGVLKHEGTGFLVNSGENDYLVSAAHIFRQCEEKELLFLTGNKIACLIQFNAMMYNKKEEDDIYDIGVMAIKNINLHINLLIRSLSALRSCCHLVTQSRLNYLE